MHSSLGRSGSCTFGRRARVLLALAATALVLLGLPSPCWACTGTVPVCSSCFAPTCSADQPQWHCDYAKAGAACNDGNACTGPDTCDGFGSCAGPVKVSCPAMTGASNFCQPASGQCGFTCLAGWSQGPTSCAPIPPNVAIVNYPLKTTSGTTGLTASVNLPPQPGAAYVWSLTGGTIPPGASNSTAVTFTAGAATSATVPGSAILTVTETTAPGPTASSQVPIKIYAPPDPSVTFPGIAVPLKVTIGAPVTVTMNPQADANYAWSIPNATTTPGATPNTISFAALSDPVLITSSVTNGAGVSAPPMTTTVNAYPAPNSSSTAPNLASTTITAPQTVAVGYSHSASVVFQPGDTYVWSISAGGTIDPSGQGLSSITFVAAAGTSLLTLTCLVTNPAGAAVTATTTIAVVPPPNALISASVSAITAGSTFLASVSAQSGNIAWSFLPGSGATATISASGPYAMTILPSLTAAGVQGTLTVVCKVTSLDLSVSDTKQVIIQVYPPPPPDPIATTVQVVANTSGLIASVPYLAGMNYAWSATGTTLTVNPATPNQVSFASGAPGNIVLSVTITNGANLVVASSATITVYPVPSCATTSQSPVTAGKTGLLASTPSLTGIMYSWTVSPPPGGTITAGANSNVATFTAGTGTSLTLICSATNGMGTNDKRLTPITIVPAPLSAITTTATAATVVAGTSFTASVPGAQPAGSIYTWTFSGTGLFTTLIAGNNTASITLSAGLTNGVPQQLTITSTVKNAAGDSSTSSSIVTVNPAPNPQIIVTADSAGLVPTGWVTVGSAGYVHTPAVAGATYNWSITGGTITSAPGSAITYSAQTAGTPVTVSLFVWTPTAGASLTRSATVQVASIPQAPPISGDPVVTSGLGVWKASVIANPNMTYSWTVSGGTNSTGSAGSVNGSTNSIAYTTTAAPGSVISITCTEVNAAGVASTAATFPVQVVAAPVMPIITSQAPVTTGASGLTASVPAHANMFYTWAISGGAIISSGGIHGQGVGGLNQISYTVTALAGGIVTITCIEVNQANTQSAQDQVFSSTIAGPTQPIISVPTQVTYGSTVAASVTAHLNMTYAWTISGGSPTNPSGFAGDLSNGTNAVTFVVNGQPGTTLKLTCVEKNAAASLSEPGSVSALGTATASIDVVPQTPAITVLSSVAPLATGLVATVAAHAGMTYFWTIESSSTSSGAAITGPATGVTSGATNTLTFAAGSAGVITLTCVETNGALASSLPGTSAPIVVGMPTVADVPDSTSLINATTAPPQGSVGALPGQPATEGGAAAYHIPIEVPPGRNGLQPTVSLDYNSRNGNGVAGVGWGLSAGGSIYRCPNILDTDGKNRPVLHDALDKLCMGGQRLVLETASAGYGLSGSTYRTEVEQYDRITLSGASTDWGSTFEVRHKSGRRSQYATQFEAPAPTRAPDTWYLVREYDPQNNCMTYGYTFGAARLPNPAFNPSLGNYDLEVNLSSITYTGHGSADSGTCTLDPALDAPRAVRFNYSTDRHDLRTSYQYGAATPMTRRLASITTSVPQLTPTVPPRVGSDSQTVRTYLLGYADSHATGRSLLQTVQVCAAASAATAADPKSACASDLSLPATTFTYQNDPPHFQMQQPQFNVPASASAQAQLQTLGVNWQVRTAPDYDGDGTADLILSNAGVLYLYLSRTSSAVRLDVATANGFLPSLGALSGTSSSPVYKNGQALLVGSKSGYLAFAPISGGATAFIDDVNAIVTQYAIPSDAGNSFSMSDVNGDGVPDFVYYTTADGIEKIVVGDPRQLNGLPGSWLPLSLGTYGSPPNLFPSGMAIAKQQDLNGDGTADQLYDQSPSLPNVHVPSRISFLATGQQPTYIADASLDQFGGPGTSAKDNPLRQWIDVNGDGLPDLFDNGVLWLNVGGPAWAANFPSTLFPIFRAIPINMPAIPGVRSLSHAFVMDVDGDGMQELIVPFQRTVDYCGGTDPITTLPSGDFAFFCGSEFETAPPAYWQDDQSVFTWSVYKFVEQPDGSYSLVLASYPNLNLQAPINNAITATDDVTGDGLADVEFRLKPGTGNGYFRNDATSPKYDDSQLGTYVSYNTSGAPDLLTSATNGLLATSSWTHRPLQFSPMALALAQPNAPDGLGGCTLPGTASFYTVSNDGSNSNGYSFFTSAMWTVSAFTTSNGVGGTNRTCYRYQDAMLSDWGRGFQGFRFITAEEQFAATNGDDQNRTSTTEFHQEFPLVGKPKTMTVRRKSNSAISGAQISETKTWWHQIPNPDASGSWIVYSSGAVETSFDPYVAAGTDPATQSPLNQILSRKTSIVQVDLASGEAQVQCSLLEDATAIPPAAGQSQPGLSHVSFWQYNTLLPRDMGNWVLGQPSQRATVTGFLAGASPLLSSNPYSDANCLSRATGTAYQSGSKTLLCGASAPVCDGLESLLPGSKTQFALFTWVPLGTNGYRKLASSSVLYNGGTESETDFTYDSFGNLMLTDTSGRDACPSLSCAAPSHAKIRVDYDTAAASYFPTTRTDLSFNHVSTISFAPETGAALCAQDVQNQSAQICKSYDALGRLTEIRDSSEPSHPQEIRVNGCTPPATCAMMSQTKQTGSPTATTYADILGRAMAQGVEGFDGNEIITRADFNARGQKIVEYPPATSGASAGSWTGSFGSSYTTSHVFDVVGRETSKTVLRNLALFNGQGDASVTTTYAYSVDPALGIKTIINVPEASSIGGSLNMFRTYDRAGHLLKTSQDVGSPSHSVIAQYFYDPMGHVVSILDSASNQITATYNDLGRKVGMTDPDKGTSVSVWDGLGRLRTETDAKGIVSAYVYDDDGRKLNRYVNGTLASSWTYDGPKGTLINVSGSDSFLRSYTYGPFLRPQTTTTDIPGGDKWAAREFVVQYAYDGIWGRLKEIEYPSGELVALDYDQQRGFPLGESPVNLLGKESTTSYRTVKAMSPRGAVTSQLLGNGIGEVANYDDSTGMALMMSAGAGLPASAVSQCSGITGASVRCTDYKYDQFSNLAQQTKHFIPAANGALTGIQATASETYQYDELQRLLAESRSYTNFSPFSALAETYTYDDTGNITSKSDFGAPYVYGNALLHPSGAGPHAVLTVGSPALWSYSYDQNGNMLSDGSRRVGYDDQDRPNQITLNGVTTVFKYSPDGERYLQRTINTAGSINRTIYYIDKMYERVDWDQAPSEERTYCGKSVVVEQKEQPGGSVTREVRYLHVDRLGSTDAVTDSSGAERFDDAHGYDAFGRPRGRDWQPSADQMHPNGEYGTTTNHGFTGHEHLDETYLIHMNGRVYDYRLGRFLSVDPIIGNPASSQSINPYSYGGNNPLSGVDPTGYFFTGGGPGGDKDGGGGLCQGETGPCGKGDGNGTGFGSNPIRNNGAKSNQGPQQNSTEPQKVATPSTIANQPVDKGSPAAPALILAGGAGGAGAGVGLEGAALAAGPLGVAASGALVAIVLAGGIYGIVHIKDDPGTLEGPIQVPDVSPGKVETLPSSPQAPQPQADGAGAMSRGPASSRGDGSAYTSKIDRDTFKTDRQAYWKKEAEENPSAYSADNLSRMRLGKAPVGADGHPMELHHVDGTPSGSLDKKTRTDHRLGDNYLKNHPWLKDTK
jgi:RHS repeat-associated protein